MLGLISWEVYNSVFNITEEIKKFGLYKFPDSKCGGVSYEKLWDEIEKHLEITYITATDLWDGIISPIIFEEYRKREAKKMKNDEDMRSLAIYNRSIFQDFECFLWKDVDLIEDDIRFISDAYNSSFAIYELEPGIYTFKDISEAFLRILQPEYERYHRNWYWTWWYHHEN